MNTPGRRMRLALAYVARNPGCSKSEAAHAAGVARSTDTVNRLAAAGYVTAEKAGSRFSLRVTEEGLAYLRKTADSRPSASAPVLAKGLRQ